MPTTTVTEALAVLEQADRLYSEEQVERALDGIAAEITANLEGSNPLVVCVLLGALVLYGKLLVRLNFPLQVDYIHATRYRQGLRGHELQWRGGPAVSPANRTILIVDDILDEGTTLAAIEDYFRNAGAKAVYKAVLVRKDRPRNPEIKVDFVGLTVPDRYVFGYGMDYKGYWRNLSDIYALATSE